MAVQMRDPVTKTTPSSAYVTEGDGRLFLSGHLAKLRYDGEEDGHLHYQIPSETQRGVVYRLDYCPVVATIRYSCPAGMHNVPCSTRGCSSSAMAGRRRGGHNAS